MVDDGKVKAAIIVPEGYDVLNSAQEKSVTLYIDSSDQMAAQILEASTQGIFAKLSSMVAAQTTAS